MDRANKHIILAESTLVLTKDTIGAKMIESWNYRSLIGMLKFLVNSTHPEMTHAVHQCIRFCQDPKFSHESAAKSVVSYLISIRKGDKKDAPKFGMNMRPYLTKGLEVYVDTSFVGDWNQAWSEEPSSVLSRA
eukprot:6107376-Ditylum_brightwellii.AAC.1